MNDREQEGGPPGWKRTTLGETLPIRYGKARNEKYGTVRGDTPVYGSSGRIDTFNRALTGGPSLIIGRKGTVGATYYCPVPCWPIDTVYFTEAPADGDLRFFKYLLDHLQLARMDRSTAVPGLSRDDYNATDVFIPALNQQRLIVAEIEKQFSRLAEAVANLKRVKANLKRYKASILKAAVEGKLTEDWRKQHPNVEPASKLLERILAERRAAWEQAELDKMKLKGRVAINDQWKNRYKTPMKLDEDDYETTPSSWVQVSLDSIASLITDGKHGDCSDEPGSGYYFLSAKDVHGGQLHYSEARQIDKDEFMEVHYRTNLELNDVLITNAGTIGRVAVAKDRYKLPFTTFQKSVAIIKPTKASVSPVFLAYYLEANVAKMQAKSAGTAVQNLLLSTLKAARFCLPSRDEQLEIVAEVDRRLSVIDELEAAVQANLTRANRLRQSILSQAFSGQLLGGDTKRAPDILPTFSIAAESQASYGMTTVPGGEHR